MRGARMAALGVLALAAAGAGGCSEFHYYDIDVTFDISTGQFMGTNEISTIQRCVLNVSGADSGQIVMGLEQNCPPMTAAGAGTHLGVVEFSTFKDSGSLTFTFDAYDDQTITPNCKTGSGTKTVQATSQTTNMYALTVSKVAEGCSPFP
jgi:hypothetical protein